MEKDLPDLYIEVSGKTYQPKLVPRQTIWTDKTMGIPLYKRIGFEFKIPLDKNAKLNELNFYRSSPFGPVQCKNILFRQFCPINEQISGSYCFKHGWTIRYKSGTIIAKYDGHKKLKYELNLLIELLKRNRRTFLSRLLYHMVKPFHRKPIWLVSDRILKADDCGEAFFQYLRQHQKQSIRTYFVIDKNSTDYSRIKKIGPTLKAFSVRHKLKHLLADCIITSSGDDKIMFPFTGGHYGYSDILCDIKHIFLQHGVIKDDLSRWLNRYNMNLYGFITSARPEYNSILNTKDYAYTKKQVWLTGLSRFDYLYNSPQKLITIAPTWRKWLVESGSYATTGVYAKSASFKSSQFFTFYNALINDPRLIKAAKKYGYKLALFLHPNFRIYTEDFEQNEITTFHDFNTTYRDIYATSSLLLTDYSSAIFDFVYLKKPVVYSQPDKDEFFSGNHSYDQGYYNYEKDGFGEVLYNLDDTVNTLIEYMRNDCKMKPKYEKRVDKFFAFHDKKNCERIYDKIIEMEKKEQ